MSDLPAGWMSRRLTELVDFPEGQVDPTRRPYAGWTLVAPDHVAPGEGRLIEKQSAAEQGAISGKYVVEPGDVIYSKIRPALRKAVLVDFEGLCSADMYPLRVGKDLDPRFLLAVLLGQRFSRFAEAVSGRSGIPKVNRRELSEYSLPVPPLGEQRRIAEILDALDARIAIAKAGQVKAQAAMEALAQALIPIKPDPDTLGDGWDLLPLGEIVPSVEYGISSPLVASSRGVPTLRMNNLHGGKVRLNDIKFSTEPVPSGLYLRDGDVLFNRTNSLEHVGRTSIWRAELPTSTFASYIVRLNPNVERLNPDYLVRWLNRPAVQQRIRRYATPGVHQVNINPTNLRKAMIELPWDVAAQGKIVDALDDAERLVLQLQRECDRLEILKRGLAADLLSGRVRV